MTPWLGRPTSYASGYMSAQRTVSSPATSQSLTRLLGPPPTYWTGLPTRESRGSSRSKSDSTGMRGLSPGRTRTPSSLTRAPPAPASSRGSSEPAARSGRSEPREPDLDLAARRLRGVRAVHEVLLHVAAPVAAEVAPDRARQRLGRVGRAHQGAPPLDDPLALDDGGHDRPRRHERHQRVVERLSDVFGVVLLEQGAGRRAQLERDDPIALRLDPAQHLAGEPAPDAVRLDEHERALGGAHSSSRSPGDAPNSARWVGVTLSAGCRLGSARTPGPAEVSRNDQRTPTTRCPAAVLIRAAPLS